MSLARSDAGWIAGTAGEGMVTIGDPRLKAPTVPVGDAAAAAGLVEAMVTRLRELNGAGLAAPQIGAGVKAAVVEVRRTDVFPDRPTCPLMVMLDPVILQLSEATVLDWEGCFSVPGLMGLVPRAESVTVRYTDSEGREVTAEHHGYVARVIQHELDHLDAIEFVDRMSDMTSLTTVANYLAHHRQAPAAR